MSQATGSPSSPSTEESRFILFRLGKEQYAVNLTDVEEVLESPDMTSVPNTVPSFIGVCNVRGQIVGVLDLRKHFNISPCETTKPVVLIFNTETGSLAALVDEIIRVADISANEITRSPTIVAKVPPQYLRGIATVNQTITCIMDLKLVLTQEELKKVSHSMQVNTKNIAA